MELYPGKAMHHTLELIVEEEDPIKFMVQNKSTDA